MRELYPECEPFFSGMLPVSDGNRIAFEVSGRPDGKPVVFLHGGPGGGVVPDHRRLFDPDRYRIILFDQRGCGRSTPHASDPAADISVNTTAHLIADIERLRTHLGVDRWQVFGGSWGSTLALAYAQAFPERVTELIVRGIFLLRDQEIRWFYQYGASELFPDVWQDYLAPIPVAERDDLLMAYHRRLFDPDPAVHVPAAIAWSAWEMATVRLHPQQDAVRMAQQNVAFSVAFARIENHYFVNRGWFSPNQLLECADRIANIPGVIVQGRYDVCTPPRSAWDLHQAWPKAELVMVPDAGHAFDEPGILSALIEATDRFAAA